MPYLHCEDHAAAGWLATSPLDNSCVHLGAAKIIVLENTKTKEEIITRCLGKSLAFKTGGQKQLAGYKDQTKPGGVMSNLLK